jgi:hypothetical protein
MPSLNVNASRAPLFIEDNEAGGKAANQSIRLHGGESSPAFLEYLPTFIEPPEIVLQGDGVIEDGTTAGGCPPG